MSLPPGNRPSAADPDGAGPPAHRDEIETDATARILGCIVAQPVGSPSTQVRMMHLDMRSSRPRFRHVGRRSTHDASVVSHWALLTLPACMHHRRDELAGRSDTVASTKTSTDPSAPSTARASAGGRSSGRSSSRYGGIYTSQISVRRSPPRSQARARRKGTHQATPTGWRCTTVGDVSRASARRCSGAGAPCSSMPASSRSGMWIGFALPASRTQSEQESSVCRFGAGARRRLELRA